MRQRILTPPVSPRAPARMLPDQNNFTSTNDLASDFAATARELARSKDAVSPLAGANQNITDLADSFAETARSLREVNQPPTAGGRGSSQQGIIGTWSGTLSYTSGRAGYNLEGAGDRFWFFINSQTGKQFSGRDGMNAPLSGSYDPTTLRLAASGLRSRALVTLRRCFPACCPRMAIKFKATVRARSQVLPLALRSWSINRSQELGNDGRWLIGAQTLIAFRRVYSKA